VAKQKPTLQAEQKEAEARIQLHQILAAIFKPTKATSE